MPIPATCPEFVSHPHLTDGRNCYTCVASLCSEEQGTSQIAEALNALGIPADVHQTGGFTMCAYIKTGDESYIYANAEGFSFYCDEECEGLENHFFGDDFDKQTPTEKAQKIADTMKANKLTAKELN
jgi:hypothetical protein